MREKRAVALMGLLLILLAVVVLRPHVERFFWTAQGPQWQVLPGENKITGLQVLRNKEGAQTATVEYFYRGDSGPTAWIGVKTDAPAQPGWSGGGGKHVGPGAGTVEIQIYRPHAQDDGALVTRKVSATLGPQLAPVAVRTIDHVIEWPDAATDFANRVLASKTSDQLYREAVTLIDEGSSGGLASARKMLERILLKEPGHAPSQIEMARVAMKTNWGPEGLRQAERYLDTVLVSDTHNVDARVLRGYVYTHQRRYKEAHEEFSSASNAGTRNLWLWANWGELALMQGREVDAVAKYRQAISGERPYDTYDRARLEAYSRLLSLLEKRNKLAEVDELHQRRIAEYSGMPCLRVEHAMFQLARQAAPANAVATATSAIEDGCTDGSARAVLGVAYYVAWAGQRGAEASQSLSQAQVFLPEGPWMFYALARSDATAKVIPKLVAKGTPINIKDNEKFNALAHSLARGDQDVARRLIRFGSRPTELVGQDPYPVALIPLMNQDLAGVNLMQAHGVNYAKLKWHGISGLDMARRWPDSDILKSLERKAVAPI